MLARYHSVCISPYNCIFLCLINMQLLVFKTFLWQKEFEGIFPKPGKNLIDLGEENMHRLSVYQKSVCFIRAGCQIIERAVPALLPFATLLTSTSSNHQSTPPRFFSIYFNTFHQNSIYNNIIKPAVSHFTLILTFPSRHIFNRPLTVQGLLKV